MNIRELNSPPLNLNYQCFNVMIPPSTLPLPIRGTGMGLVWSDEFDGTSVDTTKWNQVGPWGHPVGSSMPGLHYANASNTLAGSVLTQTASGPTGAANETNWVTGMISTDGKYTWTYGYFEARIKLPAYGPGYWPAFWMYDASQTTTNEIDILEWLGHDVSNVYQTMHDVNAGTKSATVYATDWTIDFHKYAVWWQAGRLRFYIDDLLRLDTSILVPAIPMFLMVNFDVGYGSDWGGGTTSVTQSPAVYMCDYVRIYQ